MLWRRKWQPTPVFLPGESQGWGSPVGCCLWGHMELDTTWATWQQQQTYIQISQEADKVVWYSHLFKNFPQFSVIHTVKGFSVCNEADVFLEFSCFFYDPMDVGNLISGSSAFSKSSLNIWKFSVRILLKSRLENFEQYFISMWDECNCTVVWTFLGTAFLWDWNEKRTFSCHVATVEFSKFECFLWKDRSAVACHGDRGSGCSRPGRHRVWAPP